MKPFILVQKVNGTRSGIVPHGIVYGETVDDAARVLEEVVTEYCNDFEARLSRPGWYLQVWPVLTTWPPAMMK